MAANEKTPPRCTSNSPIFKFDYGPVRCDKEEGHDGYHHGVSYDGFYEVSPAGEQRIWEDIVNEHGGITPRTPTPYEIEKRRGW